MSNEKSGCNVMIDLETTGVSAGCKVLSIGATTFEEDFTFYSSIHVASQNSFGLKDNFDTLAWWAKQSPEVRTTAFEGTSPLPIVLADFSSWLMGTVRDARGAITVWGNGADFDLPILEAAYIAIGKKKPWGPMQGRCYRTLKNLPPLKNIKIEENPLKHDALQDAIYQARHAVKLLALLDKLAKEGGV